MSRFSTSPINKILTEAGLVKITGRHAYSERLQKWVYKEKDGDFRVMKQRSSSIMTIECPTLKAFDSAVFALEKRSIKITKSNGLIYIDLNQ